MGLITDLLKEFPALSVAKERLALIEERLKGAETENKKLKEEIAELKSERDSLKEKLSLLETENKFIEFKGVLWKVFSGEVDSLAYCPSCKLAMSEFPPACDEMLICSKCNFTAPFKPSKTKSLAKKLEHELLMA